MSGQHIKNLGCHCLNCGTSPALQRFASDPDEFHVVCYGCHWQTGLCPTAKDAEDAWKAVMGRRKNDQSLVTVLRAENAALHELVAAQDWEMECYSLQAFSGYAVGQTVEGIVSLALVCSAATIAVQSARACLAEVRKETV